MRRVNADLVIALFLLVLCGAFFVETLYIRTPALAFVGADVWPRVVVVFLFILSAVYLVQSLRTPAPERARAGVKPWLAEHRNAIVCFGFYAVFLLSLPYLGMLLGSILFVFATLTALGRRTPRNHAIHLAIAVLSMGLMWSVFTFALGVSFPEGEILPR
jgi:hypothetical protein